MKIENSPAIKSGMLNQRGFSLLEMMTALAVIAVLVAVGLPSFEYVTKTNRISSQSNLIVGAFQYARSEAVNRGVNVRVEPIVSGTDWTNGFQVRIDGNDDNDFDDAEDVIIRNFDGIKSATLTSAEDTTIYYPAGDVDNVNTLTLRASQCNGDFQRIINITLSGMVSLSNNKSC